MPGFPHTATTDPTTFEIFVTTKTGATAKVTGAGDAIDAVIAALEAAGFWYDAALVTWDNGYYRASAEDYDAEFVE